MIRYIYQVLEGQYEKIKNTDVILNGIVYRKVEGGYGVYTYTEDLRENVVVPDKVEGEPVTVLMEKCFADSLLCQIKLPDSLRKIEAWAFRKCLNLEEVKIPDGVTEVGYAVFKQCKKLRRLELGRHTKTVGTSLCEGCKSIEEFVVWNELEYIGFNLFWDGGKKLTHTEFCYGLYLGNPENPYVMLNGNIAFKKENDPIIVEVHPNTRFITSRAFNKFCDDAVWFDQIDRLILHDGILNIDGGAFSLSFCGGLFGDNGMEVCADSIEMLCRAGGSAVSNCHKLIVDGKEIQDLVIPATVAKIAPGVFNDCHFPESVTFAGSLEKIGYNAFKNCKRLRSIRFCGPVGEIGSEAFYGCNSLEKLELPEVNEIGYDAFVVGPAYLIAQTKEENRQKELSIYAGRGLRKLRFTGKVGLVKRDAFALNQRLETVEGLDNIQSVHESGDPFRYTPFEGKLQ